MLSASRLWCLPKRTVPSIIANARAATLLGDATPLHRRVGFFVVGNESGPMKNSASSSPARSRPVRSSSVTEEREGHRI
jgi:hypothetical protein